jgi:[acyl-carrier-protein] S-malonyltransferase
MMSSAANILKEALRKCKISEPGDIKTIANIDAEYYKSAEKIAEGLIKQLTCPVFWQKCMEKLIADGVKDFYEIGPGKVLTGLMRRIDRKINVVNISSLQAIEQLLNS